MVAIGVVETVYGVDVPVMSASPAAVTGVDDDPVGVMIGTDALASYPFCLSRTDATGVFPLTVVGVMSFDVTGTVKLGLVIVAFSAGVTAATSSSMTVPVVGVDESVIPIPDMSEDDRRNELIPAPGKILSVMICAIDKN